jgi:excisionase family DNA binding protein
MSRKRQKGGTMEERYLSLAEACEVLGKTERTLYRWIKSGKLKAYKPGRDYEIPESAIREMREASEVYPKAEASRPEEAFRVVGRIVENEDGTNERRWTVKWNVPPVERHQYREIIADLIPGAEYDEEELTPQEARVLMAGAV